jgi:hypothetical protein
MDVPLLLTGNKYLMPMSYVLAPENNIRAISNFSTTIRKSTCTTSINDTQRWSHFSGDFH